MAPQSRYLKSNYVFGSKSIREHSYCMIFVRVCVSTVHAPSYRNAHRQTKWNETKKKKLFDLSSNSWRWHMCYNTADSQPASQHNTQYTIHNNNNFVNECRAISVVLSDLIYQKIYMSSCSDSRQASQTYSIRFADSRIDESDLINHACWVAEAKANEMRNTAFFSCRVGRRETTAQGRENLAQTALFLLSEARVMSNAFYCGHCYWGLSALKSKIWNKNGYWHKCTTMVFIVSSLAHTHTRRTTNDICGRVEDVFCHIAKLLRIM